MPKFDFKITYQARVPTKLKKIVEDARKKWIDIIVGDFHEYTYEGVHYDQLHLNVMYGTLDGESGTIAQGASNLYNPYDQVPVRGSLTVDKADYLANINDPDFIYYAVLHEFGHVVGLDKFTWEYRSLIDASDAKFLKYIGPEGKREFARLLGVSSPRDVPLETEGGAATFGQHIREKEFDIELMTGFIEEEPPMPLARLSIAMLKDLGYEVNYKSADDYTYNPLFAHTDNKLRRHGHICHRPKTKPIIPDINDDKSS